RSQDPSSKDSILTEEVEQYQLSPRHQLITETAVPYQFRLEGPGAWSGAKDAMQKSWSRFGVMEKGRKVTTIEARSSRTTENKKTSKPLIEKILNFSIDAFMMITILEKIKFFSLVLYKTITTETHTS
uniref:Flavin-containing monooxygenase n=1 Tax=Romanomermis culicivorax TaxID=13658 RepID=A0A915KL47_ROMCU